MRWGPHVGVEQTSLVEVSGRLGAVTTSQTSAENDRSSASREEVAKALEFVRAVSDPRLQVTVTFRNRSDKDLVCKGLEIPILMKEGDVLGAAVPVDGTNRPLPEFTIPAGRNRGVPQLFVAEIGDTAFWDFVRSGAIAKGLHLELEGGKGQITLGEGGRNVIAERERARSEFVPVTVEWPHGGPRTTWYVDPGPAGTPALTAAAALEAVNRTVRRGMHGAGDLFKLDHDVLVSACGVDQFVCGLTWVAAVDGEELRAGRALGPSGTRAGACYCERWQPIRPSISPRWQKSSARRLGPRQ